MNEERIKELAQQVFDTNSASDQFAVATVPFHKHNGMDSPTVPFTNLSDVPSSYYLNKGRSLIVNPTENSLEFTQGVIKTTATDGFIALPTCSGTPTGVPKVGRGASVYDTSADKLWIYNGTTWKYSQFS